MPSHTCPAPGCALQVPRSQLACRRHWYDIPKPLRDDLNTAYRRHGALSSQHIDAMMACTDFLRSNTD